jgi:hypothetical protein
VGVLPIVAQKNAGNTPDIYHSVDSSCSLEYSIPTFGLDPSTYRAIDR